MKEIATSETEICHRCENKRVPIACNHGDDGRVQRMDGKVLAFTGHRPGGLPGGWDENHHSQKAIKELLKHVIHFGYRKGVRWVISGGALGIDLWAAETSLSLRESFCPELKVYMAIPHLDHWKGWKNQRVLDRYWAVRGKADIVHIVTQEPYSVGAMHARNRHMVDLCDFLVAVWNGQRKGGTFGCLKYASSKTDVKVYWYNPLTLKGRILTRSDLT